MTPRLTLLTAIGVDEDAYAAARLAELAAGIIEMRRRWATPRTLDDGPETVHPDDPAD